MDDYANENLAESRNEWVARLVNILAPHLNEGVNSIFKESYQMCVSNNETNKYLMTFQNFLSRVPSWNQTIIDDECARITTCSKCNYMNDLLTCVHVIMLKSLTNVRVCRNQKKIDIDIPKFEPFIHKVYVQIARKLYKNIYLFEQDCSPLQKQKNNREFENIIKECILETIRNTIPVDTILRAYMSENMEEIVEITDSSLNEIEPLKVSTESPVGSKADAPPFPPVTSKPPAAVPAAHVPATMPVPVSAMPVPVHVPAVHVPAVSAAHVSAAHVSPVSAMRPPAKAVTLSSNVDIIDDAPKKTGGIDELLIDMDDIMADLEPSESIFSPNKTMKISDDDNYLSLDDITDL